VTKKKPSKPPSVRGVRGRRVIDQQAGLRDLIDSWLLETPRPTYDEMLERLKGTAYYLKRSTLARYGLEFEIKRRELALFADQARIVAQDDPDSVLELERAIANLANVKIFKNLLDPERNPIAEVDREIITVAARMQSSSSSRERARLAHSRGYKAAMAKLKEELEQILKDDPAALRAVLRKMNEQKRLLEGSK
jgi:hypothetical protein